MSVGTARNGLVLRIDEGLCLACADCLARRQCRGSAIRIIDRGEAPFLDLSRCWGCMTCVAACPGGAIVRQDRRL